MRPRTARSSSRSSANRWTGASRRRAAESRWINGPSALDHLHRLPRPCRRGCRRRRHHRRRRSAADGTPRRWPAAGASHYRCARAASGFGALSREWRSALPRRDRSRTGLVLPAAELLIVRSSGGRLAPADIVDALFHRGFKKILVEGGAATISNFIAAGMVDRLHILVAPLILGSGISGLSLPPIARLRDALRPATLGPCS